MDADLAWHAEEACRNAWPCPREVHLGGWLLRASGGPTRRTNSLNPLRGPRLAPGPALAACEAAFAELGQPAIVRVPSLADELDPLLERRGYRLEGRALTLLADLDGPACRPDPAVGLSPRPDADWLAQRFAIDGADPGAQQVYRAMTAHIALPCAFAALRNPEGIGSLAYAVLDRGLLVIESVATPESTRGRGYARRTVGALMAWGRGRGAQAACLQVVAGNTPARSLYDALGFRREVLRYHYRRGPAA